MNGRAWIISGAYVITSNRKRAHRVCAKTVDPRVNKFLGVEMFTAWQIAAPRTGDMFPRCGICGA